MTPPSWLVIRDQLSEEEISTAENICGIINNDGVFEVIKKFLKHISNNLSEEK